MRRWVYTWRGLMVPMAVGAIAIAGVGVGMPSIVQAEDEMKVEVTITDKGYDVKGYTAAGSLTKIDVRNKGSMTHGICFADVQGGSPQEEGDGEEIKGPKAKKGVRAYHLEPGEHMTLTFKRDVHVQIRRPESAKRARSLSGVISIPT